MVTPTWFQRMCLDSSGGWGFGGAGVAAWRQLPAGLTKDCPKGGGGGMFEAPLQLLLFHFVGGRHLEKMQMRGGKQRARVLV